MFLTPKQSQASNSTAIGMVINIFKNWIKTTFHIDIEIPFYANRSFKVALGLPLFFALIVILIYIFGSENALNKCCQWNPAGFSNFLKLMAVPLYLVSTAVGFGVMIARFHRSKQFVKSVKVTESKNEFDMRFKHEEEFGAFIKDIEKKFHPSHPFEDKKIIVRMQFVDYRKLYLMYFPENLKSVGDSIKISKNDFNKREIDYYRSINSKLEEQPIDNYAYHVANLIKSELGIVVTFNKELRDNNGETTFETIENVHMPARLSHGLILEGVYKARQLTNFMSADWSVEQDASNLLKEHAPLWAKERDLDANNYQTM